MTYESRVTIDEKVASLFQPDPVLAAEYFETFRRKSPLEPEKSLMLAVLEDAITCIQKYVQARNSKEKRLFRQAEDWIMAKEEDEWPFSFVNVCETLGLDPGYLRPALIRESIKSRNSKLRDSRDTNKKNPSLSGGISLRTRDLSPNPNPERRAFMKKRFTQEICPRAEHRKRSTE